MVVTGKSPTEGFDQIQSRLALLRSCPFFSFSSWIATVSLPFVIFSTLQSITFSSCGR
ncbi:hypothetical protein Pint_31888 [Pistacia integerrima]|uniref:Uncharacterized protein n=1 Tax=Pistacia integerrima TaxID=434235 RepID=A0ACC0XQH9_9ROSI|nr:hypothetical protein Pint_31888 [Pistacia integerrima]